MKKLILILAILLIAFPAYGAEILFQWEQDISPDFAGWKLYMNTEPGVTSDGEPFAEILYETQSDTYTTEQVIEPPANVETTYYFVMTAYDHNGNESDISEEVNVTFDYEAPAKPFSFTVTIVE